MKSNKTLQSRADCDVCLWFTMQPYVQLLVTAFATEQLWYNFWKYVQSTVSFKPWYAIIVKLRWLSSETQMQKSHVKKKHYHYCVVPVTDAAGRIFLAEEFRPLCQSSCLTGYRQGIEISPPINKNPDFTGDRTHVQCCVSRTFWPFNHLLHIHS